MSKVLLIEDSRPLSRVIDWILTEAGHDVVIVDSADGAAAEAKVYQPNIVLFNTGMPLDEKLPYIERIRDAAPGARVIDLAPTRAGDSPEPRMAGVQAEGPIDGYLRVPFHADDLVRAIEELASPDG